MGAFAGVARVFPTVAGAGRGLCSFCRSLRLHASFTLPILTKEMRSRMRGMRAPAALFLATGLAVLVGIIILSAQWSSMGSSMSLDEYRQFTESGKTLFNSLVILEAVLCALIAPALTSGAISTEREHQTLDLLLLTRLSGANIALGKLLSSLSFVGIILLCALPVMAISFMLGGVDPWRFIKVLLLLASIILLFGAVGLYCSLRFQKTGTAVAVAYAACLAWVGFLPLTAVLTENYHHYAYSETAIYLTVSLFAATLLCLSVAPAAILSLIATAIARRRLARATHLAILGISSIGASLLLYLPDVLTSDGTALLLYGNPAFALILILFTDAAQNAPYGAVLNALFVPLTITVHLIAASGFIALTINALNRQRG
ncbi:MAG: ABC transporter permease [Armatimonadota bacterium]